MSRILIKNGRIWNGEEFFFADVLIDQKIINKIDTHIDTDADFIFDASEKIVSCGFVDAHMHMKGIAPPEFGISAEMSSLPFGVTAAVDAGGTQGDERLLNLLGIRTLALVCAELKNDKINLENAEKMLCAYGKKAVGIKLYLDTAMPGIRDISPLYDVIEFAEKNNLMIMVHSSNSPVSMPELISSLRKGDILTHAYHGGKNNVSEDNFECIKSAKERGVIIDAGFAGHIHTNFKVLGNAVSCGAIPDIISTDITKFSAYKRGGRYGMTMCMSIAKTLGMCEEDIFRCITSSPAKAFGMINEWGYLKTGRCADVTVVEYTDEGFNLTDKAGNNVKSDTGYRCALTVFDGEVLYRY